MLRVVLDFLVQECLLVGVCNDNTLLLLGHVLPRVVPLRTWKDTRKSEIQLYDDNNAFWTRVETHIK